MGNKLTCCCLKPNASPRRGRESETVHPAPKSDHDRKADRDDQDLEFLDFLFTKDCPVLRLSDLQLPQGLIPSDHPSAGTIFLKKSQVDVRGKRKSSYFYHPGISNILPHKEQQNKVQEEHFTHNPEPESIYRFIHPFFIAIKVTAGYAISTLVYVERLLIYAEIDICPTNWKRIVFGAIVLAFKYWHDLNIPNSIFCQICKGITVKNLNELERQYFYLLQFGLNVSLSVYAKYYFDLRCLASDHGLPIAFALLRKERALNLECLGQAMNIWFLSGIENINETEDSTESLIDPVYEQGRFHLPLMGHAVSTVENAQE